MADLGAGQALLVEPGGFRHLGGRQAAGAAVARLNEHACDRLTVNLEGGGELEGPLALPVPVNQFGLLAGRQAAIAWEVSK